MAFQRTHSPDEQCSRCGTIYTVESVDYPQRDSGEFRCHVCSLQLRRWNGTREWSYTLRVRGTGRPGEAFEVTRDTTTGRPSLIVASADTDRLREGLLQQGIRFTCEENAITGRDLFDFNQEASVEDIQRAVNDALADPPASH